MFPFPPAQLALGEEMPSVEKLGFLAVISPVETWAFPVHPNPHWAPRALTLQLGFQTQCQTVGARISREAKMNTNCSLAPKGMLSQGTPDASHCASVYTVAPAIPHDPEGKPSRASHLQPERTLVAKKSLLMLEFKSLKIRSLNYITFISKGRGKGESGP